MFINHMTSLCFHVLLCHNLCIGQFLEHKITIPPPCALFYCVECNFLLCCTEPMLTIGSIDGVIWGDDWTVVTDDGSLSAQFEHTILITADGAEILTQC